MAYKLTPYDRKVRAELIRAQREGRYSPSATYQSKTAAPKAAVVEEPEKEESNGFIKALHTVGDVGANFLTGVGKALEGIVDLGAGLGGAIAGIFSDEAQESVKQWIATDWTGELYGNAMQEGLDKSALNNSKAGQIVEGVAQGVGQMLPALLVTALTGGAAAPAALQAASQTLGLATMIGSAAGTGAEEAFQDGASYGQGLAYGAASGAVEGVTEKLTGGAGKVIKKGILDGALKKGAKEVGKEVAQVGLKRVAKEALEEGAEEMISEVANPALKTIYKGRDALEEYGEGEFWGGVAEAGAVGALTSVAHAGTTGAVAKQSGIYADANATAEHINEQAQRLATLEVDGTLTVEQEVQIAENVKGDYEQLSRRLQKSSGKARARILENPQFAAAFESDGTLKADFAAGLDTAIKNAGDTSSGLNRQFYSASARGREAEIKEGLAAQGTRVFDGELTNEESTAWNTARRVHHKLRSLGFVETDLVLAETMENTNAYLDGKTIVVGKDSLSDGSYVKHLVHETTHFTEGTAEWAEVTEHVFGKDGSEVADLIERVKSSGYGVTQQDVELVLKSVRGELQGDNVLTEGAATLISEVVAMRMEETFGNERAVNRLCSERPKLATRIWERIKGLLQAIGNTEKENAEIKRLRHTEELFRRALRKAGTDYVYDQMQASQENIAEAVDESGEVRYNRRVPDRDEYMTNVMQWAFSSKTNYGETKVFYNPKDNTWNKLMADDSEERFGLLCSVEDTSENAEAIRSLYDEVYDENYGEQQGTDSSIREGFEEYWNFSNNRGNDYSNAEKQKSDGRARDVVGKQSEGDGGEDLRHGNENQRKVKYSRKIDADVSEDSDGSPLTEQQRDYFKDSRVRDGDGRLLVVYHGSPRVFTEFSHRFMNTNGNAHGRGFYFTENAEFAAGYMKEGGQLLKGYLDIRKPASETRITMRRAELLRLIKAIAKAQAQEFVSEGSYDSVDEALPDTFISDYENTYRYGADAACRKAADMIFDGNDNDVDILAELTNVSSSELVLTLAREVLGYDGVIYNTEDGERQFVAFESNQFKNTDNAAPTDKQDIRYSRKADGDTVTLSRGQLAALRANYPDSIAKGKSVANFIVEINEMLDASKRSKRKKKIGEITQDHADLIEPLMRTIIPDFSIKGYELWIDGTGAEHIEKRHGENGKADHSMASAEAKELIPVVADHPDKAEFIRTADGSFSLSERFFNADRSKSPQFRLLKQVDGDTIYVSECVPDAPNKRIYITSAYIKKDSTNQLLNMDPSRSPQPTPEAFFDGSAINNSIDQERPNVKRKIQESRKRANRNHDKAYTKSDARKVLSAVLREHLVFGNEQVFGALYGKHYTEVVDKLWHVLNDAKPGERGGVALDLADYIIDNAAVESMDFSESTEALERLQILRKYLHKLDLSEVSEHLVKKYGKQWRAKRGTEGISLERVVGELRAKGIQIKGEGTADLFLGICDAYNEARSLTVNELKTKLGEVMPREEREQRRQDIAKEILRGFDNVGEDSQLARATVRMEQERDALRRNHQERMQAERERARAERDALRERLAEKEERFQEMRRAFQEERRKLRERFERWQDREVQLDRMQEASVKLDKAERTRFFSASIYEGKTLQAIPNMLRTALKTKRAFTGSIRNTLVKVKDWYCAEGNAMLFRATADNSIDRMADGQVLFDKDIAAMLEELTSNTGELTLRELEMVTAIGNHFVKLAERYQRVFVNGKWVDAEKMADEMVEASLSARKNQSWVVRGLLNKYMRQFGDPAALFRAIDGYNPNGFCTKMHGWMRNAAITMQSNELHALREYHEWHEKHKKWAKHLENDTVEFRGLKMTVGQLMTLHCNAKTEKSKQGLADNGFKFTDKDGSVHRIKGLIYEQKDGESHSVKHDRTDVIAACKSLERETWECMNDEQRKYVELLERVLNTTCRKWKIDTDTLMKGYTLIHEDGYYFPTARAVVAKTVDTVFYEGDRVGHLSFNHDAVEGARGELLIENIDSVVLRHVHNMSLYKNYAIVAENRSMLQNIDVGTVDAAGKRVKNVHQAVTIRTTYEEFGKNRATDLMKLLDKMSSDLQGGRRAGQDEQSFLKDLVERFRSNYARYQLGLNPKTLATQLSSLIAAGNVLEYNCIVRGIKGLASKKSEQLVDKYCPLAELRNFDNSAALAAGVLETTGKVGDVLMKGIGFVDRRVICGLFYACQLQVQKDEKLELDTEENLKAAGELLTRVILETQQNSLVTEKSDAMRGGIFSRTFTMFTADGMKVIGRWFDAVGEWSVLSKKNKEAKTDADKARLEKELKRARGQFARSTATLAAQAIYMALISYLFRLLYDKDEEDVKDNLLNAVWDFIGAVLGGLPLLRDVVSYFTEGYELDNFFLSTVNDVLVATGDAVGVARKAISGKDVSRQDVASAVRKVVYSAGQVLGIPARNSYNFATGLTRRFVPSAGYTVDSLFTTKAYSSDLKKAIEAGDDKMVATITGLMLDEKIGIEDDSARRSLQKLIEGGHSVLPRSVGDTVTLNGEEIPLTGKQQKRFRTVYEAGEEAVVDLTKLSRFSAADEKVQASAISFIYDVYWDLALEDVTGEDLAEKNVLFAEAIDIEKLALVIAMARAVEADKDKNGKPISGSKKQKVERLVQSMQLSAAQKYMVMGYLGYSNANGESAVRSYIGRLRLNEREKTALMKYSGYGA